MRHAPVYMMLITFMVSCAGCSRTSVPRNTGQDDTATATATEEQNPAGRSAREQAAAGTVRDTAVRMPAPAGGRTQASAVPPRVQAEDAVLLRSMQPAQMASRKELYAMADLRPAAEPLDRESYQHYRDNPLRTVAGDPVSTFSIDVDTGSYANVRRMLNAGRMPVRDAVRAEELINYFSYDYPVPEPGGAPFALYREIAPTPWNPQTLLLHIGLRGYIPAQAPPANLVFLVDVSGSMRSRDKLDLLRSAMKLLTDQLDGRDRVSIVVYAGASGIVLPVTPGDQKARIKAALDRLSAGGSTNGAAGIRLAYEMAQQAFIAGGSNRVLLATDGDFNVGTVDFEQLLQLVKERRGSGIALSTLGFGTGNYNDRLMEQLADAGNGNYSYIDTLNEARKVLVDELHATLLTIARDVKIQIEFNPRQVAEYRLIGYENRALRREDFNNDRVDAGEIGAGHSVTALYEIALADGTGRRIDPLRYQDSVPAANTDPELAFLRLRYKEPQAEASRLLEWPVLRTEIVRDPGRTSDAFRFAAAVAGFAQALRGGEYLGEFSYPEVAELARSARGTDPFGYRGEFLALVRLAGALGGTQPQPDAISQTLH